MIFPAVFLKALRFACFHEVARYDKPHTTRGLADALFKPVRQRVPALLFGQLQRRYQSSEPIRLASARCDLPTLDDMFVEADSNRYWLLCYATRFAARCATQRADGIARHIAEEAMESGACGASAPGWSRLVSERLQVIGQSDDDPDIDIS